MAELRITVRFGEDTEDLVDFIDEMVEEKRKQGVRSDRCNEVRIAVRMRQIQHLAKVDRKTVFKRLGDALMDSSRTKGTEDEQSMLTM
jgi:Arc/MetJ-type ribon-helix-helix transcriptional regulator